MPLPEDLANALEQQFAKIPRSILTAASAELSNRYRSPDRDKVQDFMTSDQHRLAYLAVRLPATFAVVKKVLQECRKQMPEFCPKTFCDVGAGPGTASWAAADVFPQLATVTMHEKDTGWLQLGRSLMQASSLSALRAAVWKETDLLKESGFGRHDIVILSYVIGELPLDVMSRLVSDAWSCVDQMLVIIEPGTPHGFERIRAVREQLINAGAYMVAPCPHHNKCPMANGDWCHFAQRLERSSLHMAIKEVSLGYEDEKYSYVAFSKKPVALPEARILRHPQHHSGHTEFVLCARDGLEKRTISRRHKELFKKAKKLDWGDALEEL